MHLDKTITSLMCVQVSERASKTERGSYPCCVFPQIAAFVLYAVGVLYSLKELDLFDDILPFLQVKPGNKIHFLWLVEGKKCSSIQYL